MNILVVGGAGFIGSHTCKVLHKAGFTPVVLDNLSLGHKDAVKWGDFIEGEMSNKTLLRDVFTRVKPAAVIHFASSIFVGESMSNPAKYYNNNITGTLALLDVMLEFKIKQIVFSSTAAVFGLPKTMPIREDDAKSPINTYGFTKYVIEEALKDYDRAYGLKHIALRYFNAAGADLEGELGERHDPETHLIPLTLLASDAKPLQVMGSDYDTEDGTAIRDYIHVSDLADAHVKALNYLLKENVSNQFNLGTGKGFSVKEIITAAEKVTGRSVPHSYAPRRAGDPPVLITDNTKAREILGWQPEITDIEIIVKSAMKWF
jgi:UDP-arabinose 4-epimerase